MRGYPQFSFWISITLVNICISRIFSKPRKNTFELVGTVLNSNRYRPRTEVPSPSALSSRFSQSHDHLDFGWYTPIRAPPLTPNLHVTLTKHQRSSDHWIFCSKSHESEILGDFRKQKLVGLQAKRLDWDKYLLRGLNTQIARWAPSSSFWLTCDWSHHNKLMSVTLSLLVWRHKSLNT